MDLSPWRKTPTYSGVITETTCINRPFSVMVADETGRPFITSYADTRLEAERLLSDMLAKLRAMTDEASRLMPPPLPFSRNQD